MSLTEARHPDIAALGDTEDTVTEVADALLSEVHGAPDGEILASYLCQKLYSTHPEAKAVVQKYGGLKIFIDIPYLRDSVHFIHAADLADKVAVTRQAGDTASAEKYTGWQTSASQFKGFKTDTGTNSSEPCCPCQ